MRRFIVSGMIVALASLAWYQVAGAATWPPETGITTKAAAGAVALSIAGVATALLVPAYDLFLGLAQFTRRLYRHCTR